MRKNNHELTRMQNLIESDRFNTSDDFFELLTSDMNKILKEYFDLSGKIKIDILKNNSIFKVEINFEALRLKTFGTLPK